MHSGKKQGKAVALSCLTLATAVTETEQKKNKLHIVNRS